MLRRAQEPPLHKKGGQPRKLKSRHFVYKFVEDGNTLKKSDISVILTQYVKNVGYPGDVVSVRPNAGYFEYILTGIGVYDNPENRKKYGADVVQQGKRRSPFIERTMDVFAQTEVEVVMNNIQTWVLEPWHVRVSMAKHGLFVANDSQIVIDAQTEIAGPDEDKENKLFYVTVTIDGEEKVKVRCRLRQWCIDPKRRPKIQPDYHLEEKYLFAEDAEEAEKRRASPDDSNESEKN